MNAIARLAEGALVRFSYDLWVHFSFHLQIIELLPFLVISYTQFTIYHIYIYIYPTFKHDRGKCVVAMDMGVEREKCMLEGGTRRKASWKIDFQRVLRESCGARPRGRKRRKLASSSVVGTVGWVEKERMRGYKGLRSRCPKYGWIISQRQQNILLLSPGVPSLAHHDHHCSSSSSLSRE